MIRPATPSDRFICVSMAKEVYGPFMAEYGISFVEEDLLRTADLLIGLNQVLVVEHNDLVCGMAAWVVSPHPANSKIKVWQEILWCLKSKFNTDALLLIRAMEDKAQSVGANIIVLANLSLENEPTLRRIYGKRGYNYLETHYSRRGLDAPAL